MEQVYLVLQLSNHNMGACVAKKQEQQNNEDQLSTQSLQPSVLGGYSIDLIFKKQTSVLTMDQIKKITNRIQLIERLISVLMIQQHQISETIRILVTQKALLHYQLGQFQQTLASLEQAIEVYDILSPSKKCLDYIGLYNNVGIVLGKLKRKSLARKKFIEAFNLYFQVMGTNYHEMLIILLNNYGNVSKKRIKQKRQQDFLKIKSQKVALPKIQQQKQQKQMDQISNSQNKLSIIKKTEINLNKQLLQQQNKEQNSIQPFKKCRINEKLLERFDLMEFKYGNFDSIAIFKKILEISIQQNGEDHIMTANIYHNIANQYSIRKQYSKSKQIYEQTLKRKISICGQVHYEVASTRIGLANCHFKLQHYKDGLIQYRKILNIFQQLRIQQYPLYREFIEIKFAKNLKIMLMQNNSQASQRQEALLLIKLIDIQSQRLREVQAKLKESLTAAPKSQM